MARIVVVEDDNVVAWHIQELLERLKHTVVSSVSSGLEAIQVAQDAQPDVVLMDIRLQGEMDGITAAEEIYTSCDIPVIYLTAHTDAVTLQRATLTAPFGYLVKPLREQDLQTTIEITLHRHQLERRARRTHHWFATTLSSIGDGTIATDCNGTITFMNSTAETLTGWRQQDALGQSATQVLQLVHADTRETLENPLLLAIQTGTAVKLPERAMLRSRDGRESPIGDIATPIRNETGQIIGSVLVFQDVSDRRQVEAGFQRNQAVLTAQLQEQAAQLQQTLSQFSVGLACIRSLQHIFQQLANQTDEALILKTTLHLLGQSLSVECGWVTLYDDQREFATVTIAYKRDTSSDAPTIGTQIGLQEHPQFYLPLSQKHSWIAPPLEVLPPPYQALQPSQPADLHLVICPIEGEHTVFGEVGFMIRSKPLWTATQAELVSQVMSQAAIAPQKIRAQPTSYVAEELRLVNQLKEGFLSSISHELRTPLTNMRMAVEMLQRIVRSLKTTSDTPQSPQNEELLWERMERYLQVLHDEWQLEFNLISDLLNFQNTEHSTEPLLLTPIIFQQWLPLITHRFKAQATKQQQTLTCDVAPNFPLITSHLPGLERIVSELINNACKYTPPKCSITVTAHTHGKSVSLRVINTGVDIPPHELERIFQTFYRVANSNPWNYRGTGLGLAVVKRLVTRLGGEISAQSQDGVTTFTVTLPITG